jgi:hypothetical protein
MGLDGNRTLIHAGFLDWCNDGSIFEQDISEPKLPGRTTKSNQSTGDLQDLNSRLNVSRTGIAYAHRAGPISCVPSSRIASQEAFLLQHGSQRSVMRKRLSLPD